MLEHTALEAPLLAAMTLARTLPTLARHPRSLGALAANSLASVRSRPMVEQILAAGFVELVREPGRAWVAGCVGRLWTLTDSEPLEISSPEEFKRFAEPGYAKATLSFSVEPAAGGSRLETETLVETTSESARRAFDRYWHLTLPASAAIRRDWLAAIRRRAERSQR